MTTSDAPLTQTRSRGREALAVLACAAIALVPLGTGPWTGRIPYLSDVANTFHPLRSYTHASLARGETPWWNPHSACGIPHATDPQNAYFYPLNRVLDRLDPAVAIGAELAIHLVIASLLTYALARALRFGRGASVFAAASFVLSGFVFHQIQAPPPLRSIAWTPGVLLGAALLRGGRSRAGFLSAAVCWALSVLGGHAQFSLTAVLPALAIAWDPEPVGAGVRLRTYASFAAALAVGSLVAAVGVLPGLAYAPFTQRALGFSPDALRETAMSLADAPGLLFGRAEHAPAASLGLVVAALAVAAVAARPRASAPLAGVAVFGFVAALGPATPVGALLHSVPPFGLFHYTARHVEAVQFAVTLLAAGACDAWLRDALPRRRVVAAAGVATLLWAASIGAAPGNASLRDLPRALPAIAGVALLLAGPRVPARLRSPGIVLCCVAELAALLGRLYWRDDRLARPADLAAPPPDFAALPAGARDGSHRVVFGPVEPHARSRTLAWSIDNAGGHLPLVPLRLLDFASTANDGHIYPRAPLPGPVYSYGLERLDSPLLDVAAVRWAVRTAGRPAGAWREIAPGVWERPCRFESVRVVPDAVAVASREEAARVLADPSHDPGRAVVVEDAAAPAAEADAPLPRVTSVERHGDGFTVRLAPGRSAWLAASYNALPGFTCEADGPDGADVPVRTGDLAFLAVRLPGGTSQARFTYTPPGLRAGAALSALGLALLAVLAAGHPRRRPASGAVPPGPARG